MRLRSIMGISAVVASIVMVGALHAGDAVKSGLALGEVATPFDIDDVTGPNKGRTLCYR